MKVYLAAQVFSLSTADALDNVRHDLDLPTFAETVATADL